MCVIVLSANAWRSFPCLPKDAFRECYLPSFLLATRVVTDIFKRRASKRCGSASVASTHALPRSIDAIDNYGLGSYVLQRPATLTELVGSCEVTSRKPCCDNLHSKKKKLPVAIFGECWLTAYLEITCLPRLFEESILTPRKGVNEYN